MATSPDSPIPVRLRPRPQLAYRRDLCIACGACAAACRAGAVTLRLDPDRAKATWRFVPDACLGCGKCVRYCSTGAITLVPPDDEAPASPAGAREADFSLKKCLFCDRYYAPAPELAYLTQLLSDLALGMCPTCRRQRAAVALRVLDCGPGRPAFTPGKQRPRAAG